VPLIVAFPFVHPVQIYYEDTDHSGRVYHANFLRYFERAREHLIGVAELVRMQKEDGVGFVVYKVEVTYKAGAEFGDTIEIRTTSRVPNDYRVIFQQDAYRDGRLLAQGFVHLVCVNTKNELVPLPATVMQWVDDNA